MDESWTSALAIVAHPDDLEYGTAAAVARWTAQGKRVVYCLATSGEAGIDGMAPEECGPLREQEQRASAAIVGVDEVEFLGYPDGVLEYGLPLRRDIARAVRRHRPDVVITGNYHESWGPGALNQADHIALGRAVLDGVRDAANRWVFRELLDEGLQPWHAKRVLVAGGTRGDARRRRDRAFRHRCRLPRGARGIPRRSRHKRDGRPRGVPRIVRPPPFPPLRFFFPFVLFIFFPRPSPPFPFFRPPTRPGGGKGFKKTEPFRV